MNGLESIVAISFGIATVSDMFWWNNQIEEREILENCVYFFGIYDMYSFPRDCGILEQIYCDNLTNKNRRSYGTNNDK